MNNLDSSGKKCKKLVASGERNWMGWRTGEVRLGFHIINSLWIIFKLKFLMKKYCTLCLYFLLQRNNFWLLCEDVPTGNKTRQGHKIGGCYSSPGEKMEAWPGIMVVQVWRVIGLGVCSEDRQLTHRLEVVAQKVEKSAMTPQVLGQSKPSRRWHHRER